MGRYALWCMVAWKPSHVGIRTCSLVGIREETIISGGAKHEATIGVILKNILVPTDLSEGAEEALDYACEMARQFGARIHLLNVIGIPVLGVPELGLALTTSVIDDIVRDNQHSLDQLAARKLVGVRVGEILLRTGDAREVIVQTAKDLSADLIVMSTHGRRGVSRALLGSVTEMVVRTAPCPVLTVHMHLSVHPGRDEVSPRTRPSTIRRRRSRSTASRRVRRSTSRSRWSAASPPGCSAYGSRAGSPEMTTDAKRRARMVGDQLRHRGIVDPAVLDAFARVPREEFVEGAQHDQAYADGPLPIGYGQTISQPYVVAITAQELQLQGNERVLEIGTGSGYAAAIFGVLAREVETIERIRELAQIATERLARLGYANVHVHHGDGTLGWPAHAPYEAIAVAANAPAPPQSLLDQLAIGGRMVLPVGDDDGQRLVRITRRDATNYTRQDLGDVRFVPLVGAEGWPTTP